MSQSKTKANENGAVKTTKERVDSTQVTCIKETMNSGEFSIGNLAKKLDWPFRDSQKKRSCVILFRQWN